MHQNHGSFRCSFGQRGRHLDALARSGSGDGWPSPQRTGAQMQSGNIEVDRATHCGGGAGMLAVYWLYLFGIRWRPNLAVSFNWKENPGSWPGPAAGSEGWMLLRSISEISDLKSEWFSCRARLIPVHQSDTTQLAKYHPPLLVKGVWLLKTQQQKAFDSLGTTASSLCFACFEWIEGRGTFFCVFNFEIEIWRLKSEFVRPHRDRTKKKKKDLK